jgi:hypothetical protein
VWPELVRAIWPLLGLGTVFFALAARNTRKRLD